MLGHGEFVSGQVLADTLKVSRATISTWVGKLENYGLQVNRVHGRGYRLTQPIRFIDKKAIIGALPDGIGNQLGRIDIFAETDSTNKQALSGNYDDLSWQLMISEYQSVGRGRRGKQWVSPFGSNLLFSLAKKAHWPPEVLYKASIIVGLAVAQVFQQLISCPEDVKVKWPNDVYINGRKVAGVLCELQGSPVDESLLVIGIGINVFNQPQGEGIVATRLLQHMGGEPDRNVILAKIVERLLIIFEQAQAGALNELMSDWASFDFLLNKPVTVSLGASLIEGIARGMNEQAELLVEMPDGQVRAFNGGEVSVRA